MVSESKLAVAVRKSPKEALRLALSKLGEPLLLSHGSNTVIIKPSIYDPRLVGNTSLAMTRAVVDLFRDSFDVKVVESDNPIRTAEEAFEIAGYGVLRAKQVELVNLSKSPCIGIKMPGLPHGEHPMPTVIVNHPLLVNVATAKLEPEICTVGAGIKNLFGLLPEPDKSQYHKEISKVLVDLLKAFRPVLTILDLTEVAIGPRTNGIARSVGGVIVGNDPVAVDAYCVHLLGLNALEIPYLKMAYDAGLGEAIVDRMQILGTTTQIKILGDLMNSFKCSSK